MVSCYCMFFLIKSEASYPIAYGRIFLVFGILIGLYVIFLIVGPPSNTEDGRIIQATGQKIIVYG